MNCRCVNCKNVDTRSPTDRQSPEPSSEDTDRMTIMAAVAMTELFGGSKKAPSSSNDQGPEQSVLLPKRKWKDSPETMPSVPVKKHKKSGSSSEADAEVRAAVSLESTLSEESRNPSPVSMARMMPPPTHFPGYAVPRSFHRPVYHAMPMGASPPPYGLRASPPHYRASPPPPYAKPPYEELVRTSGLPKSLSFRKICSKCGKTRGEHGELGFGNKCVFQDCGKCGAGVQMHQQAGQPMGILCQLTVQQGATAGAAALYERKIRDLAVRADLQKELQRRKQETAAERALAMQKIDAT